MPQMTFRQGLFELPGILTPAGEAEGTTMDPCEQLIRDGAAARGLLVVFVGDGFVLQHPTTRKSASMPLRIAKGLYASGKLPERVRRLCDGLTE